MLNGFIIASMKYAKGPFSATKLPNKKLWKNFLFIYAILVFKF